ncbi:MAG: translation initiation factor IF-3 [Candidatus Berkelbacteria bacterium]|nr:translation initiation factor IF-3 [Candidatus Berkelbacteria bacterium]
MKGDKIAKNLRINQQIRAQEVHLIDENAKSQGVVSLDQALLVAHQRGYDLVEVTSSVYPPITRLLDYGKYLYQLEKEEKKGKQKRLEMKEIRMKLSIEPHDLEVKTNKMKEFLDRGHKLKITVVLRGREMAFVGRAFEFIKKIEENTGDNIQEEKRPQKLGNRISVVLSRKSN